ncbi:MAG TPA: sulfotransferase [Gallionella sp.]|nr:sulfotransferase [Gallionella sp.]
MKKIAIFGTPRSGTSWLGHIFNSHPDVALRFQPLFSYGHKGSLSTDSSAEEIRKFFEDILNTQDTFATMKADSQKNYPAFQKSAWPSHIVFKETRYLHIVENILKKCSDVKIVGIVRNPLAVLASWMSAPKEFNHEWDIDSEWRGAPRKNQNRPEEFFGFDKWKESAAAFLQFQSQFPQQFILVRYGELNRTPLDTTKLLFDFCELEVCGQVRDFLSESKSRHDEDPYSVYRAKANDTHWKDILPTDIVDEVCGDLRNTSLQIFLSENR